MKSPASVLLLVIAFARVSDPEPRIPYFSRVRDVSIAASGQQNYVIIDADVWQHARADLADLRLYDGPTQVPYALLAQRATTSSQPAEARIFNLVRTGDHTEFDLDTAAVPEYNRIHLTLDRKNFFVTASVTGRDTLRSPGLAAWPTPAKLFDFSRENLGSNFTIALPTWRFRYVHVRLSPGIVPDEVKRATVDQVQEKKSLWTEVGACRVTDQQKRVTMITCDLPPKVAVQRIRFEVSPVPVNFRRNLSIANPQGVQLAAGEICRIRMNRDGTAVASQSLAVDVFGETPQRLMVTVDNGDDPPLTFSAIQAESIETRLYFDPRGRANLKLYYGDEKLGPPVYDYAKFFRDDRSAVDAKLGSDRVNPQYTGRSDDRPWSERHKALLWSVMVMAVVLLTALAVRGLQGEGGKI